MDKYYKQDASKESRLHLQRLTDIHLFSHLDSELGVNGDIADVYIFSVVALFVLLIACFNFTNLAVARSIKRAREIGVRKVMGAYRWQLIGQFLSESMMIAFIAVFLAVALVELALPVFNDFSGKELSFLTGSLIAPLIGLLMLAITVGIVAGSYPAFFLSAFRPVKVLKGEVVSGSSRPALRKVLVVAQFAISIVLISGVGMINQQLEYMQSKELGFNKEQLIFFGSSSSRIGDFTSFRNQLLQHPGVRAVTASKFVPSHALVDNIDILAEVGDALKPVNELALLAVDHQFFAAYGMDMAAGRAFSPDFAGDSTEALIVNETAARTIGWKFPGEGVGKRFSLESNFWGDRRGTVVGVVKDFHFESLHERIAPMIFFISPKGYNRISVKIAAANIPETLKFIESVWQRYFPKQSFACDFVDQRFAQLYQAEERLRQVVVFFASLAIFIAGLGLLGLASFLAEQRTREIGIRKILGATVAQVTVLLSKDFLKLVIAANLIAWPVAWYVMKRWLENFAYRSDISWWIFLMSGGVALVIALLTVSFQAIRAALANPVESLRYE
jgi:putative ABC transport system permease protein